METRKATHRGRNIALAFVLILVLGIVIIELIPRQIMGVSYTLVTSGTTYTIAAGQYDYAAFGLPPAPNAGETITYTLTGSFTASNEVAVYLMNYTSFTSSVLGTSYIYSSGNLTSAMLDVSNLPVSNAYYLVFYNYGLANSTITIAQAFVASGTPRG